MELVRGFWSLSATASGVGGVAVLGAPRSAPLILSQTDFSSRVVSTELENWVAVAAVEVVATVSVGEGQSFDASRCWILDLDLPHMSVSSEAHGS